MVATLTPAKISPRFALLRRRLNPFMISGGGLFLGVLALVLLLPLFITLNPNDERRDPDRPERSSLAWNGRARARSLARLVYGGQNSLYVGASVMVVTAIIGAAIGLMAGIYPRIDGLLMRVMDVLMAFPALLLALAILAAFGNTAFNVVLALSLVYVPRTAKIVRGEALVLREQTFIQSAQAIGASPARIVFMHMLPGIIPALVVQETFLFAYAILGKARPELCRSWVAAAGSELGQHSRGSPFELSAGAVARPLSRPVARLDGALPRSRWRWVGTGNRPEAELAMTAFTQIENLAQQTDVGYAEEE